MQSDPTDQLSDRLTELETRVAFQDDTIQKLNDVVAQQERRLQRLERESALLREQLKQLVPSLLAPSSEETPPPHY